MVTYPLSRLSNVSFHFLVVSNFKQVFTLAQQLADAYDKLCHAGCLLFSEWKLTLYCQRLAGKVSVHVDFGVGNTKLLAGTLPLRTEMEGLRDFMKKCYEEWMSQMNAQRTSTYHLNYYNTQQIVHLRKSLAVFRKNGEPSLDPQTLALLCCVKSGCTVEEVQSAVESILGPKVQQEPEASVSSKPETPSAANEEPEDEGQKKIRTKLKRQDYSDAQISAAFAGLGKGKQPKEYKRWINKHGDQITQVQHRQQSHQAAKGALVGGVSDDGR